MGLQLGDDGELPFDDESLQEHKFSQVREPTPIEWEMLIIKLVSVVGLITVLLVILHIILAVGSYFIN